MPTHGLIVKAFGDWAIMITNTTKDLPGTGAFEILSVADPESSQQPCEAQISGRRPGNCYNTLLSRS